MHDNDNTYAVRPIIFMQDSTAESRQLLACSWLDLKEVKGRFNPES